ncbi:MAG: transposase [Bilifractor sp.]|nr:IS66 family transposase [Lachnospiraceae bacterium]MDY2838737.1 transposase [Bilifractor sp.]
MSKETEYHVIHADETPVEVRKDGRSAGAKSYMWVYRSGALEEHPFVLYEYDKTRKTDHPRAFLKDYHGTVVTDGLADYHLLDKERDDLTFAGCWIHI